MRDQCVAADFLQCTFVVLKTGLYSKYDDLLFELGEFFARDAVMDRAAVLLAALCSGDRFSFGGRCFLSFTILPPRTTPRDPIERIAYRCPASTPPPLSASRYP